MMPDMKTLPEQGCKWRLYFCDRFSGRSFWCFEPLHQLLEASLNLQTYFFETGFYWRRMPANSKIVEVEKKTWVICKEVAMGHHYSKFRTARLLHYYNSSGTIHNVYTTRILNTFYHIEPCNEISPCDWKTIMQDKKIRRPGSEFVWGLLYM